MRGVYARRGLAAGEAVFGRSDIDLTVVVDPSSDLDEEAARMAALARRLRAFRRVLPVVGPPEVATPSELGRWYASAAFPGSVERDRGWRCVRGAPFERPTLPRPHAAAYESELPWFFWAWRTLIDGYRRGRVRACCNMLLDMVNVYLLYAGAVRGPERRGEVLARWIAGGGETAEHAALARVLAGRHPRSSGRLLRWVYGQGLRVIEAVAALRADPLAQWYGTPEVRTRVPFQYEPCTYVLVEARDQSALDRALDRMDADPTVTVATAPALALYFHARNPWEYFTIAPEERATCVAPPPAALRRAIAYYLHPIVPRRIGFAIGTGVDRNDTLGPQYAQARLWLEHGTIAASRDELVDAYTRCFGAWPYRVATSPDAFFAEEYPRHRRTIDALTARLDHAER